MILLAAVEERITKGALQKPEGTKTVVYDYIDDEGMRRFVHYKGGKATVKVNSKKVALEDQDDGGEAS